MPGTPKPEKNRRVTSRCSFLNCRICSLVIFRAEYIMVREATPHIGPLPLARSEFYLVHVLYTVHVHDGSKEVGAMSKKHMRILHAGQVEAIKQVVTRQLVEAMKKRDLSKARMAVLLNTSRSQVDRLLDPKSDITLSSLQRAAGMVGRRVAIKLV